MADVPYLTIRDLSKRFDEKTLFEQIGFSIQARDKVALLARNGTGKTTLIRILAELEKADQGEILFSKEIRVGFVFQNPKFDPESSIRAAILSGSSPAVSALREYERLQDTEQHAAIQTALENMEKYHGWDMLQELQRMMSQLRLDQIDQPMGQLSGGQKRRIDLVRALLEKPDFLILDEPTNHLDLDMIEWLENTLTRSNMTLFMVTHDRYFLEAVCNRILELEQGNLYQYSGNFSFYLEQQAQRQLEKDREHEAQRNLYLKELAWVRKQPRARGTKSKSRVEAFEKVEDQVSAYKQDDELKLDIQVQRLGGKILELEHLSKSFAQNCVIDDFSHTFSKGDRIGIIGRNGTGKSTFLNLIMGQLEADQGIIDWGVTVKTAYYHQQGFQAIEPKARLIEVVRDVAEFIPLKKGKVLTAAQLLERFLFPADTHFRPLSTLSGGEHRRLYLLTLLMTNPNFLILDEPTNDLDLQTLQVLEDFLLEYSGCLVVVSHDRYMMDKMVDHLLIFEGDGQIVYYPGSYSKYWIEQNERLLQEKQALAALKKSKSSPSNPNQRTPKLSWKELQELEGMELKISKIQVELNQVELELANASQLETSQINSLSQQHGSLQTKLEKSENRWLELEEKREAYEANQP